MVAVSENRIEIGFTVLTDIAPTSNVTNFETLSSPTLLAAPFVTLQYFSAEGSISFFVGSFLHGQPYRLRFITGF